MPVVKPLSFGLGEILIAIGHMSKNKAPGPDRIPADLFVSFPNIWAPILLGVFNAAAQVEIPISWKISVIVPIFKKGDRGAPHCYRPISLIDTVTKVIGRILLTRLRSWAEEWGGISRFQYGFRPGLGTVDQCLNLNLIINKYTLDKEGSLHLAFMDLSSAFDCVNRSKLWSILNDMGIDPSLIDFLKLLHKDMKGTVRYSNDGKCSETFDIYNGVRQGCILAPFLFTLYIHSLDNALLSQTTDSPRAGSLIIPALLYADDAVLLS